MKELILGGVRSGKSRLAEARAEQSGLEVVYIATAEGKDDAFSARIETHQQRRPEQWLTVEEPLYLAATLEQQDGPNRCLLIDCLTLWLTNLLCSGKADLMDAEIEKLLEMLPHLQGHIILVSNEAGLGVTPMGQLSRDFLDTSGELHQSLATLCNRVTLSVAGLPMVLKDEAGIAPRPSS